MKYIDSMHRFMQTQGGKFRFIDFILIFRKWLFPAACLWSPTMISLIIVYVWIIMIFVWISGSKNKSKPQSITMKSSVWATFGRSPRVLMLTTTVHKTGQYNAPNFWFRCEKRRSRAQWLEVNGGDSWILEGKCGCCWPTVCARWVATIGQYRNNVNREPKVAHHS